LVALVAQRGGQFQLLGEGRDQLAEHGTDLARLAEVRVGALRGLAEDEVLLEGVGLVVVLLLAAVLAADRHGQVAAGQGHQGLGGLEVDAVHGAGRTAHLATDRCRLVQGPALGVRGLEGADGAGTEAVTDHLFVQVALVVAV
ncbi:hypothetical protein DIZ40_17095, partial [Legionella pneumophila]